MLSTPDVVPLMLTALPTFQSRWQRHLAAWSGKKAGDYNDVGEFAQHLVDLYAGGETAQVRTGLDLVEPLRIEGDDDVRQLAVLGILENILNIASSKVRKAGQGGGGSSRSVGCRRPTLKTLRTPSCVPSLKGSTDGPSITTVRSHC